MKTCKFYSGSPAGVDLPARPLTHAELVRLRESPESVRAVATAVTYDSNLILSTPGPAERWLRVWDLRPCQVLSFGNTGREYYWTRLPRSAFARLVWGEVKKQVHPLDSRRGLRRPGVAWRVITDDEKVRCRQAALGSGACRRHFELRRRDRPDDPWRRPVYECLFVPMFEYRTKLTPKQLSKLLSK